MKIAFFGSSLVSAYWNGAATYYRGLLRAMHERGHQITFYEPDAYHRQQHRDIDDPPYAKVVVYPANSEADPIAALREARSSDLLIKASGVGVFDTLLERAVLEERGPGAIVAYWDVDAAATLERLEKNPEDSFRPLVSQYDVIFTYGGGDGVVKSYHGFGAKHCYPVYNALDPSTHFPVEPNPQFSGTLGFLGNRLPDREERVKEFFFTPALKHCDKRFLLGGSGWENNVPQRRNITYLGHVYTRDHNAFNCTLLAVLNICRDSMARRGFSPPTRLFEAAGAAACLISDAWEGIEDFLEPGRECLVAEDGHAVGEIVKDLSESRAREIGRAALQRIIAQHTYAHRAEHVETILKNL
ncbi:MAG TPA: glycosyltransferase [Candidatus Binatia bacterium]|nr:glycosyltransferase [Candidatus Binatia bacterium]